MKKSYLSVILLNTVLCLSVGVAFIGCQASKADKTMMATKAHNPAKIEKITPLFQPQIGKPLGKVCVVYSDRYHIEFLGLERLHAYRQHYRDIYYNLRDQGLIAREDVYVPSELTEKQILTVHSKKFLDSLKEPKNVAQYLEAGFIAAVPSGVVDGVVLRSFRTNSAGTLLAARLALDSGIGINLGGGYHHAMRDRGEGFNIYADIAIAIRVLQKEGLIKRVLIVDLDAHQGNGSAEIFAGDDSVFTFSMHEEDIYPDPKSKSDLDVEFPAFTDDDAYLAALRKYLPYVLKKSRPDLVILQGGCDVLAGDPLTYFRLTPAGLIKRDAMVIDECVKRKIPIATTLGGGYGKNAWKAQAKSISNTIKKYGTE